MDAKWREIVLQGRKENDSREVAKGLPISGKEIWLDTEEKRVRALYYPSVKEFAPVYINFHGGGFVYGRPEYEDWFCDLLRKELGAAVFNIDYSLAPEFPFPHGLNDCYCAVKCIYQNAEKYALDMSKVIIGGCSAGGNLATVVCQMLKGETLKMPVAQLLIYPALDCVTQPENKFYMEGVIPQERQLMYNECYLQGSNPADPRCSPTYFSKEELADMPDALILTCEYDCLRDEGEQYALQLIKAGNEVTCRQLLETPHGCLVMDGSNQSEWMIKYITKYMRYKMQ